MPSITARLAGALMVALSLATLANCSSSSKNTVSPTPQFSEPDSATFAVGDTLTLVAVNFAGTIKVSSGPADTVRIGFTKWVDDTTRFSLIDVQFHGQSDSVDISSTTSGAPDNSRVDFDITLPPDVQLHLNLGAGTLDCTTSLRDSCRFVVGAGNIVLSMPNMLDAQVDLATGAGSVACEFAVVGTVLPQSIVGAIGSGQWAHIYARVGAGSIQLLRQP